LLSKLTTDPQHGLTAMSTLIPSLLELTPPSSYPLFALLRLRALLLTPPQTSQGLQECIASYALAYAGAETTHPPGHPTLAVILAEWGKTLSMELPTGADGVSKQDVMRRLMEAVVVLRKAYTACERGFGPGGGIVGKEVEGLIRGCEGEIGLMRYAQ
jgi:SET and MYND domain-containing protein